MVTEHQETFTPKQAAKYVGISEGALRAKDRVISGLAKSWCGIARPILTPGLKPA